MSLVASVNKLIQFSVDTPTMFMTLSSPLKEAYIVDLNVDNTQLVIKLFIALFHW